MNWYRFKIELTFWAIKTALSVFTMLTLATVYEQTKRTPFNSVRWTSGDQLLGEHLWLAPAAALTMLTLMWIMFLCAFCAMRSSARYGKR